MKTRMIGPDGRRHLYDTATAKLIDSPDGTNRSLYRTRQGDYFLATEGWKGVGGILNPITEKEAFEFLAGYGRQDLVERMQKKERTRKTFTLSSDVVAMIEAQNESAGQYIERLVRQDNERSKTCSF